MGLGAGGRVAHPVTTHAQLTALSPRPLHLTPPGLHLVFCLASQFSLRYDNYTALEGRQDDGTASAGAGAAENEVELALLRNATKLLTWLAQKRVKRLFVAGLATDYVVKNSTSFPFCPGQHQSYNCARTHRHKRSVASSSMQQPCSADSLSSLPVDQLPLPCPQRSLLSRIHSLMSPMRPPPPHARALSPGSGARCTQREVKTIAGPSHRRRYPERHARGISAFNKQSSR